jgi:hypothetical protein
MDYAGNSKLFNDSTYSDLVVKWGKYKWHCHKCIAFSSSGTLQRLCEPDPEDSTRDQVILDDSAQDWSYSTRTIDLLLRSMYEPDEALLFQSKLNLHDHTNLNFMAAAF